MNRDLVMIPCVDCGTDIIVAFHHGHPVRIPRCDRCEITHLHNRVTKLEAERDRALETIAEVAGTGVTSLDAVKDLADAVRAGGQRIASLEGALDRHHDASFFRLHGAADCAVCGLKFERDGEGAKR